MKERLIYLGPLYFCSADHYHPPTTSEDVRVASLHTRDRFALTSSGNSMETTENERTCHRLIRAGISLYNRHGEDGMAPARHLRWRPAQTKYRHLQHKSPTNGIEMA